METAAQPHKSKLRVLIGDRARSVAGDPVFVLALIWAVLAFALRPWLMAIHYGEAHAPAWLASANPKTLSSIAAGAQWLSLAGLLTLLTLVQLRISRALPDIAATRHCAFAAGVSYALACAVGYLAFVWTPTTAVSLMLHDAFIFFDAIYRIDQGQVPSHDFPTSLGAACLYLPALAAWMTGGFGGAIELASCWVALCLGAACAYGAAQRHSAWIVAALVTSIFLVVTPAILEGYESSASQTLVAGEFAPVGDKSAVAMFYNRWGWGAMIALFAFLGPAREKRRAAEVFVFAAIIVFLAYLKASYAVVAVAAAAIYAFGGDRPWRTLALGAACVAAGFLAIGLVLGNLFDYVGDVFFVTRVSGGRVYEMFGAIGENLIEFAVAVAPWAVLVVQRRATRYDHAVAALTILGSLFLINQNAQSHGIPTLMALSAYCLLPRQGETANGPARAIALAAFVVLTAHTCFDRATGLLGQVALARSEESRGAPPWVAAMPMLKGVYAQEREAVLPELETAQTLDQRRQAYLDVAMLGARQVLRTGDYMRTLAAAKADLESVMSRKESVALLDFSNPLDFIMNGRPGRGFWITFDEGRTISEDVRPTPEALFADIDHVMIPKVWVEPDTAVQLRAYYEPWIAQHYRDRAETAYWVRYSHRLGANRR